MPRLGTSDIETKSAEHPLVVLSALAARLQRDGKEKEAKTILQVVSIATASPDYGGMGLTWTGELSATDRSELILLTSACKHTSFLLLCRELPVNPWFCRIYWMNTDRERLPSLGLESLNSNDRRGGPIVPLVSRPAGRRPMNVTEKIFALHDVTRTGWVRTGDTIRVSVDWIMASEASWHVCLHVTLTSKSPQAWMAC